MATIGLDKLFYSKITEGENGDETYATPVALAKAMTAELSVELAEATLYADDGAAEVVKEFQSGTLTLGVDDIGKSVAEDLTGAVIDENGVLISASEGCLSGGPLGGREAKKEAMEGGRGKEAGKERGKGGGGKSPPRREPKKAPAKSLCRKMRGFLPGCVVRCGASAA